jgi:hypothetical protein
MSDHGFRYLYGPGGPDGYYRDNGDDYRNPHEPAVSAAVAFAASQWGDQLDFSRVLDLAAGGGEATLALAAFVPGAIIDGIDPYTHRLYERRAGRPCAAATFEQIALGAHPLSEYSCILASCALHLVADSWLPTLCLALAASSPDLLVITPLTRPEIREAWGWRLVEQAVCAAEGRDVRLRWYRGVSRPPARS